MRLESGGSPVIIAPLDYERYAVILRPLQDLETPQAFAPTTPRRTEPVEALKMGVERYGVASHKSNGLKHGDVGETAVAGSEDEQAYPSSRPSTAVAFLDSTDLENAHDVSGSASRVAAAYEPQSQVVAVHFRLSG